MFTKGIDCSNCSVGVASVNAGPLRTLQEMPGEAYQRNETHRSLGVV